MDYENRIFEWETDSIGNNMCVCVCMQVARMKAAKNDVKHMEYHNSKQIFHRIYVTKQWKIAHKHIRTVSHTHIAVNIVKR